MSRLSDADRERLKALGAKTLGEHAGARIMSLSTAG